VPTPKQQLIEKIINRTILHARRVGFVGIDGELRRQLNRTTLNNLITLWNEMEKKENEAMASTDKRTTLNSYRLEHEGEVWYIDGKFDPATKTLKVYRVNGDVTKQALLNEALEILTNELGLSAEAK
jgi:hypothetical protein